MKGYCTVPDPALSVVCGISLEDEPGLGPLTLPGFLREVTDRHGPREAIVQPRPDGTVERAGSGTPNTNPRTPDGTAGPPATGPSTDPPRPDEQHQI